ncbi:hypothetical protein GUJ93_ZPchr0009g549 [Zizania palustris]|uniref:Uncharacterized protein n=1 Tax=Zizania palustris TaxID=103762 RepID=A0A8J5S728_ZIZPA|nr:hypothetical protein GUJ93_ZPchr0009g549 [Zizania palustris]
MGRRTRRHCLTGHFNRLVAPAMTSSQSSPLPVIVAVEGMVVAHGMAGSSTMDAEGTRWLDYRGSKKKRGLGLNPNPNLRSLPLTAARPLDRALALPQATSTDPRSPSGERRTPARKPAGRARRRRSRSRSLRRTLALSRATSTDPRSPSGERRTPARKPAGRAHRRRTLRRTLARPLHRSLTPLVLARPLRRSLTPLARRTD